MDILKSCASQGLDASVESLVRGDSSYVCRNCFNVYTTYTKHKDKLLSNAAKAISAMKSQHCAITPPRLSPRTSVRRQGRKRRLLQGETESSKRPQSPKRLCIGSSPAVAVS